MKKFFTQILVVIGFVVSLAGLVLEGSLFEVQAMYLSLPFIAACMATAFVFAKNETVKNMGYVLASFAGFFGLNDLLMTEVVADDAIVVVEPFIFPLGMVIMIVPAAIYVIIEFFSWLGFTRKSSKTAAGDIATVLNQYKALEKEQVLSSEEFEDLKTRVLKNTESDLSSLEDLKKWKKLLDQQIITEEEFTSLKAKAFNK